MVEGRMMTEPKKLETKEVARRVMPYRAKNSLVRVSASEVRRSLPRA
jgi:hypothetical protein